MKKFLSLLLVLSMLLACGCDTGDESSKSSESTQNSSNASVSNNSDSSYDSSDTSNDNQSEASNDDNINNSNDDTSSGNSADPSDGSNDTSSDLSGDISQGETSVTDLMSEVTGNEVSMSTDLTKGNSAYTSFAVELFKKSLSDENKNTLISPLSVIYALGLTANGADGNTLKQLEEVFGLSTNELNNYLYSYAKQKADNNDLTLNISNSIWFRNGLPVNQKFLQTNADFYNASAYKAVFSDSKTVDAINAWVNEKTKGVIPKVIDETCENDIMYLINALTFEADWVNKYHEGSVRKGKFASSAGAEQDVEFMWSEEHEYLEADNATGFLKRYKNKYAFAALLSNEGVSIEELVSSLDGEKLSSIIENRSYVSVTTSLPKFEAKYEIEMKNPFKALGVIDAFDNQKADFSKTIDLSKLDGNVYISQIIHKTFISVAEQGTKAGAVTAVIENADSAPSEYKEVILDRPFVYMLLDMETNTPIFIGTLMDVESK